MIENDGDIVRGLGFVTLYGAYLEEQIENLLRLLDPVESFTEEVHRSSISRQIRGAMKTVKSMEFETKDDLLQALDAALGAFEWRNEVVHGRIYANFDRSDTLKAGRPNIPDREITADELYDLANYFDDLRTAVYRPMVIKIPRFLGTYQKPA